MLQLLFSFNVIFTACSGLLSFDLSRYRYKDAMFSYDFSISDNSSSSDRLVGTPLSTDVL